MTQLPPPQSPPDGPPRQQPLQPQPTPFQPFVGQAQLSDGSMAVLLQIFTLTGQVTLFMPPEGAAALASDLMQHSRSASSGIVLPPGVNLTPDGH